MISRLDSSPQRHITRNFKENLTTADILKGEPGGGCMPSFLVISAPNKTLSNSSVFKDIFSVICLRTYPLYTLDEQHPSKIDH